MSAANAKRYHRSEAPRIHSILKGCQSVQRIDLLSLIEKSCKPMQPAYRQAMSIGNTGERVEQAAENNALSRKADLIFAVAVALVVFVVIISLILPIKSHSNLEADEISAINSFKDYIEAQTIYARNHRSRRGQPLFARVLKTLGESDGSLIDSAFAHAEAVGDEPAIGKAGYVYKTLIAQGSHAKGGKKSYIDADGEMTLGFALVAYPAAYDSTGKRTFVAGADGIVYCKDLGRETEKTIVQMTEFDPDETWTLAK
jgi:hypothetical protein